MSNPEAQAEVILLPSALGANLWANVRRRIKRAQWWVAILLLDGQKLRRIKANNKNTRRSVQAPQTDPYVPSDSPPKCSVGKSTPERRSLQGGVTGGGDPFFDTLDRPFNNDSDATR